MMCNSLVTIFVVLGCVMVSQVVVARPADESEPDENVRPPRVTHKHPTPSGLKDVVNVWLTVTPMTSNASIPLPRAVLIPNVPLSSTIAEFRKLVIFHILNTLFGLMVQTIEIPGLNYLFPTGKGQFDHKRVPVRDSELKIVDVVDAEDVRVDRTVEFESRVDLTKFLERVAKSPFFSDDSELPAKFNDAA